MLSYLRCYIAIIYCNNITVTFQCYLIRIVVISMCNISVIFM